MIPEHTIITQHKYIPHPKMDATSLEVAIKSTSVNNVTKVQPITPVIRPINIDKNIVFTIYILLYLCK